jgi:multiple sugar transport system ATP-binding protein
MAQVTLQNVFKSYPGPRAAGAAVVRGFSLEVAHGEFMVLVGPSGCGKSTTLRMIAGLEDISAGEIAIGGRRVNEVPPQDRDIAMVFQNYALYPHLSVYENLAFGLRLRKVPGPEIDRQVRAAAGLLGLGALLERKPKALSGGQRQRVALGRAIVRQPQVFLFDEPLSNLDATMRASTRLELARLHARLGATMIYVTHDQVEAMALGDRICVMHEGEIQQVADPLTLYNHPANTFVAGFIGTPPMNFFPGISRVRDGRAEFVADAGVAPGLVAPLGGAGRPAPDLPAGRPLLLGIRPEALRVAAASGNGLIIEGTVLRAELMGSEVHLHLQAGENVLIARVDPAERPAAGAKVRLTFDPARAHCFDATTRRAL